MSAPVLLLASAAAPVVDIDGTIFIQAGIFLVLMAILHPLLFQPWLAARARREHAIGGHPAGGERAAPRGRAFRGPLRGPARHGARRGRDGPLGRDQGRRGERQRRLAEIRAASSVELQGLRDRLAQEAEVARGTLTARVDELALDVATRILGRTP
jgi:F-type H+-transporting ATPase subunit b